MNEDRNFLSSPILYALAFVMGILIGLTVYKKDEVFSQEVQDNLKKFKEVISLIDREYVDKVDVEELTERAIRETLVKLDPHSNYIEFEDKEVSGLSFESNYEGIGIEFNILNDTLVVISPMNGGPSQRLGILHGDKILSIDGENVAGIGLTNRMVFDKLRGPEGTKVRINVKRENTRKLLEFEIQREKIPSISVDAFYMLNKTDAYIKVSRFTESTVTEFRSALNQLINKGMNSLILDLRNNSGGVLVSALMLADEFISDDKLILYTKGKDEASNFRYEARYEGLFESGDLIVLINEGSASASEIVAGALQDHDRALIVGRRSFGKGLVQSSFDLRDGSELRMTISRYFIPSGRSIQKPYGNGRQAYMQDIIGRFEHGEFFHADSISFPDSLVYRTESGRKVYGGGGIMPDVFVPVDTSFVSDYLSELNSKSILYEYCFEYANKHRESLSGMGLEDFDRNFNVDQQILSEIRRRADDAGISHSEMQFEKSRSMIRTQVKAMIARNIWRDTGFYKIFNRMDPVVKMAEDLLREGRLALGRNK
jgi:carboxyl-terminal processing protease